MQFIKVARNLFKRPDLTRYSVGIRFGSSSEPNITDQISEETNLQVWLTHFNLRYYLLVVLTAKKAEWWKVQEALTGLVEDAT